jgi:hypothetical protein
MASINADLVAALELAANRFDRLTLEFDYGTQPYFDCIAWAREARALAAEAEVARLSAELTVAMEGRSQAADRIERLERALLATRQPARECYGCVNPNNACARCKPRLADLQEPGHG